MQFWATLHSQAGALRLFCSLKSKSPWNHQRLCRSMVRTLTQNLVGQSARGYLFSEQILVQCYEIPGDYSPINSRPKCKQQCWKWWDSQQNETCGLSLGILLEKTVPNPKNDATASCDTGGACNFAGRSLFCTEHRQSSNTCTWRMGTSCPSFMDCLHERSVPTRCIPGPSSCPTQLSVDLAVFQQCTGCLLWKLWKHDKIGKLKCCCI